MWLVQRHWNTACLNGTVYHERLVENSGRSPKSRPDQRIECSLQRQPFSVKHRELASTKKESQSSNPIVGRLYDAQVLSRLRDFSFDLHLRNQIHRWDYRISKSSSPTCVSLQYGLSIAIARSLHSQTCKIGFSTGLVQGQIMDIATKSVHFVTVTKGITW